MICTYHPYCRRNCERVAKVGQLADAGGGAGIFCPVTAHQQQSMRELAGELHLPVALIKLGKEVGSLPLHPQLTQVALEIFVANVNRS